MGGLFSWLQQLFWSQEMVRHSDRILRRFQCFCEACSTDDAPLG